MLKQAIKYTYALVILILLVNIYSDIHAMMQVQVGIAKLAIFEKCMNLVNDSDFCAKQVGK